MPFRMLTLAACLCGVAAAPVTLRVDRLVAQLGDESFDVRQEAHRRLVELGPDVLPSLDEALKRSDPEVRLRAAQIIERIRADREASLPPEDRARVGGKYARLLKRIHVPKDEATYTRFCDYGFYECKEYAGHGDLPGGYWVYVAPHWYIWAETSE